MVLENIAVGSSALRKNVHITQEEAINKLKSRLPKVKRFAGKKLLVVADDYTGLFILVGSDSKVVAESDNRFHALKYDKTKDGKYQTVNDKPLDCNGKEIWIIKTTKCQTTGSFEAESNSKK